MNIIISNASGRPFYEQIYDQLRAAILSGEAAPGELLPSIRALARDLRVSVITTKRAYDELERDGFINTVAGRGCFVAERSPEWAREEQLRQIEGHLQQAVELARQARITGGELLEMLRVMADGDGT